MNDLFVYDSFKTVLAAETTAKQLVDAGVPRQAIALGAERDLSSETDADFSLVNAHDLKTPDVQDDDSLWDRIVGIFQTDDETNEAAIDYDGYRSAIALGDILLLVEEDYRHVIEQTVDPDTMIKSPEDSQNLPTEADRRLAQGGSFASEDLNFQSPEELAIPQTEIIDDDPLVDDTVNLDRDFEKDPRR